MVTVRAVGSAQIEPTNLLVPVSSENTQGPHPEFCRGRSPSCSFHPLGQSPAGEKPAQQLLPPPLHAGLHTRVHPPEAPSSLPSHPLHPRSFHLPLAHHLLGGTAPEHHKAHKGAGEWNLCLCSLCGPQAGSLSRMQIPRLTRATETRSASPQDTQVTCGHATFQKL